MHRGRNNGGAMKKKARVIAYYLPQYHPCTINDEAWGKGFTEWTNVARAKPLYKGHYQPQIPADLGFYDLRVPEVREQQAKMARECGIEGFCYWHYWFGNGKRALNLPFDEVLKSGEPDFPFCLGWANHSWEMTTWNKDFSKGKMPKGVIIEQTYPGKEDYIEHFYKLLPAFKDKRYICVNEKPLFLIFRPEDILDMSTFIELWNRLAKENGLKGIHFVGKTTTVNSKTKFKNFYDWEEQKNKRIKRNFDLGFNALNTDSWMRAELECYGYVAHMIRGGLGILFPKRPIHRYDYERIMKKYYIEEEKQENIYPTIIPRLDKTPRVGRGARIWSGCTPEKFERTVKRVMEMIKDKDDEHKIVFLQSWNEWGEGNYMEPDDKFGHGFMEALKNAVFEKID